MHIYLKVLQNMKIIWSIMTPFCTSFANIYIVTITGDFNVDLLKLECPQVI